MRTILIIFLLAGLTPLLQGCAGRKTTAETPTAPGAATENESYGPPVPEQIPPQTGEVAPPPVVVTAPEGPYVLVLGPGLARSMALVGVFQALEKSKLQITAVVGVEMGALLGAIWTISDVNALEWQVHKFRRDTLLDFPIFGLQRKVAEGKKLYKFIEKAVTVPALETFRIPFVVVSEVSVAGGASNVVIDRTGSAKDVLRGTMGLPGVVKSYEWNGLQRNSGALEQPYPVRAAKDLNLGKTLCVDVVGPGDNFQPSDNTEESLRALMKTISVLGREMLKQCDGVISVPLDGFGYLDFSGKAELVFRGRTAAMKWLQAQ